MPQNLIAVLAATGILVLFALAVLVAGDVRDRAKPPPIPKRVLDRYDADGRRIDL
jgi:hypothetical protein